MGTNEVLHSVTGWVKRINEKIYYYWLVVGFTLTSITLTHIKPILTDCLTNIEHVTNIELILHGKY